jgi:hypothetical protein
MKHKNNRTLSRPDLVDAEGVLSQVSLIYHNVSGFWKILGEMDRLVIAVAPTSLASSY